MSSEEARAPTPAVYRVSPLYDIYGQTLYPYINHKLSGVTPYLSISAIKQPASKRPFPASILSLYSKFLLLTVLHNRLDLDKDPSICM